MAEQPNLFRHILVPTDGSEASIEAGKLAIRLAGCQEARLTFVYVLDEGVVGELAAARKQERGQVRAELEQKGQRYLDYLKRLADAAGIASSGVIRKGEPCDEITGLAGELKADLIAMGRVGAPGLRRVLIGSLTEMVIENAKCAVLVV